jgi:serine/threonine-protein kinase
MSPEQARGKPVDKRADIFAFGCVLYEILTGKRAFGGETIAETIAAVIHKEPDWKALPDTIPWRIGDLLRQCLQKEPQERLHDIANLRIGIKQALSEPSTVAPIGITSATQPPLWKRAIPWGIAVAALLIAGVAIWTLAPASQALTKLVITPSPTAPLASYRFTDLAISPDGSQVIYRVEHGGIAQLYVRSMGDFLSTPIVGTEGVDRDFFFSPDGDWLAFVTADKLKKISLAGGTPITLCDASSQEGGSWDFEDMIVFAANLGSGTGLYRVSANGGQPESIALPNVDRGDRYRQPEVLPNGKAVLFAVFAGGEFFQIAALSLETGEQKILIERGRAPHYAPTGHLIYGQPETGILMAAPFDIEALEVTGDSVPILEGVRQESLGFYATVDYVFSREGTLAYVPAPEEVARSLVWVDRKGTETPVTEEKRNYRVPRVSPDGQSISVVIGELGGMNVWLYDLKSDSLRRFTFEEGGTHKWSPDGKWIAFSSRKDGPNHLYRKLADGSGSAERLTTDAPRLTRMIGSWSPDGALIFFDRDIYTLSMDGKGKPELLIAGGLYAVLSSDGQWLAYVSTEGGESSVYVSRYSEPEAKWQISGEEGGREPLWSPDGTELFYRSGDRMMVVSIQTEPAFNAGKPTLLFEESYVSSEFDPEFQYYDISPDGQRFLMIKEDQQEAGQINVILNWFEELKRLVPTP